MCNSKYNKYGNIIINFLIVIIDFLTAMALLPSVGFAGIYWVSPTGKAKWSDCSGSVPLDGISACSLATANLNAVAGDIVYLRGGTYSTGISPSNSGLPGKVITFSGYFGETPLFTGPYFAINIQGKNYIKISGITVSNVHMFFFIGFGANYNEITGSTFYITTPTYYSKGLITSYDSSFSLKSPSTHNWIHHNTFSHYGSISSCDDIGTIRIAANELDESYYNTIENNIFFYGGHDCFDLGGKYNVIRNNIFHNEEAYYKDPGGCTNSPKSGYFGNRNLIITRYSKDSTKYNLIEGNRFGYAGTPPDDDGSFGIENAGTHIIIRYNYIFGNGGAGYYSKTQNGSADYARIFNNTIYSNGYGDEDIDVIFKGGVVISCGSATTPISTVIKNNIIYGNFSNSLKTVGQNCSGVITYTNNYNNDPNFINPDMSDKTNLILPNLGLQLGSGAIDSGTHLTQANGSGSNSTTLVVDDALYFQDGKWGSALSNIQADWIAIGSVDNVVQIKSIDYFTNTITLKSPMSWSDRAKIWLYKKSDGERVLYGSAPDYGAHEFIPSSPSAPTPPKNLRIQ